MGMQHTYLMFEHVRHRKVFENAAPSGVGVLEVADHLLVNVQILL